MENLIYFFICYSLEFHGCKRWILKSNSGMISQIRFQFCTYLLWNSELNIPQRGNIPVNTLARNCRSRPHYIEFLLYLVLLADCFIFIINSLLYFVRYILQLNILVFYLFVYRSNLIFLSLYLFIIFLHDCFINAYCFLLFL